MAEIKGIEVKLIQPFNFVKETLERMGVVNKLTKTIYPSCYILQKRGKYYIIHFKNMFVLDGKHSDLSDEDNLRQTAICKLLAQWGLVEIVDSTNMVTGKPMPQIFVLPYDQRDCWTIQHKYKIGSFKKDK